VLVVLLLLLLQVINSHTLIWRHSGILLFCQQFQLIAIYRFQYMLEFHYMDEVFGFEGKTTPKVKNLEKRFAGIGHILKSCCVEPLSVNLVFTL